MRKNNIHTTRGLILLVLTLCHFQVSGKDRTRLLLHTDRNYYLAGETIYFAMEANIPHPIVLLELVDESGTAILQHKYSLEDGHASGQIPIPLEVESRNYYLRAYPACLKHASPASFTHVPLMVIHPLKVLQPGLESHSRSLSQQEDSVVEKVMFRLEGLRKTYAPADSIRIRFSPLLPQNNAGDRCFTISLVKTGTSYPEKSYLPILPELEEATETSLLKGKVTSSLGKPVSRELILLSPVGAPTHLLHTRTGADGSFSFPLDKKISSGDLILQAPGLEEEVFFSLEPEFPAMAVPLENIPPLPRDSLEEIINEIYVNARMSRIYDQSGPGGKMTLESTKIPLQIHPFYGEADQVLILDEYIKLPIMEEVLRELGKRIFLEREKGQLQIRLLDLRNNRIIGDHPWFFLDGVPFFSSRKLLELNPADIHSIHMKSERYFLGEIIMDGIIDIHTHRADASLLELPPSVVRQYYHGIRTSALCLPEETHGHAGDPPQFSSTQIFLRRPLLPGDEHFILSLAAPVIPGSYDLLIEGRDGSGALVFQRQLILIE